MIEMRMLFCLLIISTLAGCNRQQNWQLHNITGHLPDLQFSLTSDNKQTVTDKNYQGYIVLLFFGYTNCHIECLSTLFHMTKLLPQLGGQANLVQLLFVTLDPKHDTAEILRGYLANFDSKQTVGLTGSEADIRDLTKRYRVAFQAKNADLNQYSHTVAVYVFDQRGRARLLITPMDSDEAIAMDVSKLILAIKKSQ